MRFSNLHSAIFIVLSILTVTGASFSFAQTAPFDANQTAQQLSDQVGAKLGSKAGIGQNAVNPLTAGAPMTSMTGTTQFYAPNRAARLRIISDCYDEYLTTGPDIANVYVQRTRTSITYQLLVFRSRSRLQRLRQSCHIVRRGHLEQLSIRQMVRRLDQQGVSVSCILQDLRCFCVNNGCGYAIVTNEMDYILSVLGGGIAGALQAVNPKWTVSGASSSFMQISYTGQNIDKCVAPATNFASSTVNPQQLYNGGQGSLDSATQSEVSSETLNPSSAYNTIQAVSAGASSAGTVASCSLASSATVSTVMVPTPDPISYTFYATADNNFNLNLDGALLFSGTDWHTAYTQTLSVTPGNHTVTINATDTGGGYKGILFALRNNGDGSWPVDRITAGRPVNANYGTVGVGPWGVPSGWPEATAQWIWGTGNPTTVSKTFDASLMIKTDTLTDPVATDNCISMETNTQCALQNEVVDGVQTIINYNPTGLAPISSCRNFTGQIQTFNVCHNWWSKCRTYYCKTATTFDFTNIKARSANISTTSTAGGGDVTFQDKTPDGSGAGFIPIIRLQRIRPADPQAV